LNKCRRFGIFFAGFSSLDIFRNFSYFPHIRTGDFEGGVADGGAEGVRPMAINPPGATDSKSLEPCVYEDLDKIFDTISLTGS